MATDTGDPWTLPYPENTDDPLGPSQIGDFASALDSALGRAYPCTSGTRPAKTAGLLIYETDTDKLRVTDGSVWKTVWADTSEQTTGMSPASGFSDDGSYYQTFGLMNYIHIQVNRTGSDLTFGANGGLSDTGFYSIPSTLCNQTISFQSGSGGLNVGGTLGFSWRLQSSSGNIQIISGAPATTITSGDTISADFYTLP